MGIPQGYHRALLDTCGMVSLVHLADEVRPQVCRELMDNPTAAAARGAAS